MDPTKSSPPPAEELLVDLLPRCRLHSCERPMELHMQEVEDACSTRSLAVQVWVFQELAEGQSLQALALRHSQGQGNGQHGAGNSEGPFSETSLKFMSKRIFKTLNFKSIEEAASRTAMWWRTVAKYRQHWKAQIKNLTLGNYGPVIFRSVVFGNPGGSESTVHNVATWPAVVVDAQGKRHWGMVGQALKSSRHMQQVWGLRDLLSTEYTPACICMAAEETGELLWQNSASMELFGCHGVHNVQLLCTEREVLLLAASGSPAAAAAAAAAQAAGKPAAAGGAGGAAASAPGAAPAAAAAAGSVAAPAPAPAPAPIPAATTSGRAEVDFMHLLFNKNQELLLKMKASTQCGNTFRSHLEITHPTLRLWLGLTGGQEAHHDVQISLSRDPLSLKKVFIISQTDVTDTVGAERRLREMHAELAAEKLQSDALLHRQYQLIEYLSKVTEERNERRRQRRQREKEAREARQLQLPQGGEQQAQQQQQQPEPQLHHDLLLQHQQQQQQLPQSRDNSNSTSTGLSLSDLIESVRRQIAEQGLAADAGDSLANNALEIQSLLGEGSFGKVYRGFWRGTPVAIKSIVLPSRMSGAERLERMAIMEAAISSSLSHPNIVQTYTYHVTMHKLQSMRSSASSDSPLLYTDQGSSACESLLTSTSPESSFGSRGLELRLVLEYMDCGSLRDVLNKANVFQDPASGRPHHPVILETAADVAKGMLHLHSLNIIHGDLKALNVLLKSSNAEAKGFRAKISDFGLSSFMTSNETHISKAFMGTTSHMAPEVLIDGRQSKAADVYAFGITLFELYSASTPFKGIPQALLAYQVAQNNVRPAFPEDAPRDLVALAEACWSPLPQERPTFEEVLASLSTMCRACPDSVKKISVQDLQLPSASASVASSLAREEAAVQLHPPA